MVDVRMTFGKHKGRLLCDVPTDYLVWALNTIYEWRPWWLQREVERELDRRAGEPPPRPPRRPEAPPPADRSGVVKRWHREMVMRFHPDRGGSTEAMAAINHASDRLRELAGV